MAKRSFGAMNGKTWYSISAKLFRDGASDKAIGAASPNLGRSQCLMVPALMPGQSLLYESQGQRNRYALKDGQLTRLVQDKRLIWPTTFALSGLMVIHRGEPTSRNPIFTGKPIPVNPVSHRPRVDWVQVNLGANIEPFSKRVPLFTNVDRSIHLGKPAEGTS